MSAGYESLLKRTVVVTLALLVASAAWVGLVSVAAVTIVDRAVGGGDAHASSVKIAAPGSSADAARPKVLSSSKPNG